jgi:hypothetical protein
MPITRELNSPVRFLLAALQMDALLSDGITDVRSLHKSIERLPTSLDDQYERTLKRIEGQSMRERDLAFRTIVLVTYASSILDVDEVLDALTVDIEEGLVDQHRRTTEQILIDACMGLVTIEKKSRTVQLIRVSIPLSFPEFKLTFRRLYCTSIFSRPKRSIDIQQSTYTHCKCFGSVPAPCRHQFQYHFISKGPPSNQVFPAISPLRLLQSRPSYISCNERGQESCSHACCSTISQTA